MKLNEIKSTEDDSLPTKKYSDKELYAIAKKAGHQLYDSHGTGLIWHNAGNKVIYTNTTRQLKEQIDAVGNDVKDPKNFVVSTFEYSFKPSSGKGRDSSDSDSMFSDFDKMKDADGYVYLCDNTDGAQIRVMKQTIKSKADYDKIFKEELARLEHERSKPKKKVLMGYPLDQWKAQVLKLHPEAKFVDWYDAEPGEHYMAKAGMSIVGYWNMYDHEPQIFDKHQKDIWKKGAK